MNKTENVDSYFLCSENVIKSFPKAKKSRPFKSGYDYDKDDNYYIVLIDFKEVESFYNKNYDLLDFWVRECIDSLVDISCFEKGRLTNANLFSEIQNQLELTTETNVAYTLFKLSESEGVNPIDFINNLKPKQDE